MPLGTIKEATGALQLYLVLYIENCQVNYCQGYHTENCNIVIVGLDCIVNRV